MMRPPRFRMNYETCKIVPGKWLTIFTVTTCSSCLLPYSELTGSSSLTSQVPRFTFFRPLRRPEASNYYSVCFSLCRLSRCDYCYMNIVPRPRRLLGTWCLFLLCGLISGGYNRENTVRKCLFSLMCTIYGWWCMCDEMNVGDQNQEVPYCRKLSRVKSFENWLR